MQAWDKFLNAAVLQDILHTIIYYRSFKRVHIVHNFFFKGPLLISVLLYKLQID